MFRPFAILLIAAVLACSSDDNEIRATPKGVALKRAASLCNTSQNEMDWLSELITDIETKDDLALVGTIYAFRSNGEAVFMHQPMIMSCWGCILYDCQGNRLDHEQVDLTVLAGGYQTVTEIYTPSLE